MSEQVCTTTRGAGSRSLRPTAETLHTKLASNDQNVICCRGSDKVNIIETTSIRPLYKLIKAIRKESCRFKKRQGDDKGEAGFLKITRNP
jgi:hypothetical protein